MKKIKKDEKLLNTYQREERKLFLGGIAEETTEKDLKKAFSPFGTIMDCKVNKYLNKKFSQRPRMKNVLLI